MSGLITQWASWMHNPEKVADVPGLSGALADDDVESAIEGGPIKARPFRTADGTLSPFLSTFTISSGILLWSHILPMHYGSLQSIFTDNAASPPPHALRRYHQAARLHLALCRPQRRLEVCRYFSNWRERDGPYRRPAAGHVEWVFCHADVDPMDVISKVRAIDTNQGSILFGATNALGHGSFHELPGPSCTDAARVRFPSILEVLAMPPRIRSVMQVLKSIKGLMLPWDGPDFVQICRSFAQVAEALRPDIVIVDNLFSPALTVCQHLKLKHLLLSPNSLKDFSVASQS
ncbi:hypothetical protein N0V88_006824 [Collariella sp. IMI 366227]|nr:hypothetical protein N0V88_006824 [Collariella sp. IMI 366227]